jgi:type IV pilus assembly protein PilE
MRSCKSGGFTLIELVVVIAILGILVAIAVPTYLSQMRHSRRGDAITALGALSLLQESFRATNPDYGDTLAEINGTGPGTLTHYNVTITFSGGNDGTNYILTAAAKAGDDQNNDRSDGSSCASLVLTVVNNARTKSPTSCWR